MDVPTDQRQPTIHESDSNGGVGGFEGCLLMVGAVVGTLIGAALVAVADKSDVKTIDDPILIVAIPFAAWGVGGVAVTAWAAMVTRVTPIERPARGLRKAGQGMTAVLAALVPAVVAVIFTRYAAEYAGWGALLVLAGLLASFIVDAVRARLRRDAAQTRMALMIAGATVLILVWVFTRFELRGWLSPWAQELGHQPQVMVLVGAAFIVAPVLGMSLVITRRSRTGISVARLLGCGVLAVVIALIGVLLVLGAITLQPGTSTF